MALGAESVVDLATVNTIPDLWGAILRRGCSRLFVFLLLQLQIRYKPSSFSDRRTHSNKEALQEQLIKVSTFCCVKASRAADAALAALLACCKLKAVTSLRGSSTVILSGAFCECPSDKTLAGLIQAQSLGSATISGQAGLDVPC